MNALNQVRWIELPSNRDNRGILTSIESGIDIPFTIKRVFYMHHIVSDRGGHAHRDTDQVVIAISGRFVMELSDGIEHRFFELDDPTRGVYIPRMIFIKMYNFTPDAVCCVLASTHYDITRSIRSWEEYLQVVKNQWQT
ncbi:MAG: FdtA/QdtA family cupin domain-containing protein [Desulfobacterota bacterium]|nr:FdtA/QdtA family cupin domain-containing protein [Thermodesulfobacteriota bacterium]